MPPGDIEFALIPLSDQYVARYLVNPIRPDFTTEYVIAYLGCKSCGRFGSL